MNPTRPALLVVDVQRDFCPGGALAVRDGDRVVPPLNRVIQFFEKIKWPMFFSRDWHPKDTNHFKEFGGKWPTHCIQRTDGANFHSNLYIPNNMEITYFIYKGVSRNNDDGYSPFKNAGMPLNEHLVQNKVSKLYVGGLATDYCVKAACLDARKLGYTVYLMLDACRAMNLKPTDEDDALEEMRKAGAIFTTTDEVLR